MNGNVGHHDGAEFWLVNTAQGQELERFHELPTSSSDTTSRTPRDG
jgi:hypothetical protein